MRGKVSQKVCADEVGGITPAHAGKRLTKDKKYAYEWDHPRTCGEKR